MGGILGRRAWERSNGGVWLPAIHESPNQMGFCCCGSRTPCNCCDATNWPDSVTVRIDGCWGYNGDWVCDYLPDSCSLAYSSGVTDSIHVDVVVCQTIVAYLYQNMGGYWRLNQSWYRTLCASAPCDCSDLSGSLTPNPYGNQCLTATAEIL